MSIIEGILAAVATGKLREPFSLADVAGAITEYQYGSIQAALSRYSQGGRDRLEPPLTRVAPGRYRLTCGPAKRRLQPRNPSPGCAFPLELETPASGSRTT